MNINQRSNEINGLLAGCMALLTGKGKAYSGEEDANSNFKRNATLLGMTKYQVLAIYLNKHLDGINNAIKLNPEFPEDPTEGMKGRIMDAINYLAILHTLIVEDNEILHNSLQTRELVKATPVEGVWKNKSKKTRK